MSSSPGPRPPAGLPNPAPRSPNPPRTPSEEADRELSEAIEWTYDPATGTPKPRPARS